MAMEADAFDNTRPPDMPRITPSGVIDSWSPGRSFAHANSTQSCPPREALLSSGPDRKSTRLNSSHLVISYAVFCLKKNIVDQLNLFRLVKIPGAYANACICIDAARTPMLTDLVTIFHLLLTGSLRLVRPRDVKLI